MKEKKNLMSSRSNGTSFAALLGKKKKKKKTNYKDPRT